MPHCWTMRSLMAGAMMVCATPIPVLAQAAPDATGATTAAPPQSAEIVYDITNRMTLPVTIDGAGPFAFIVDTGAEHTVISQELARSLNLRVTGSARIVGVARETTADLFRIDNLQLAGLNGTSVTVAALDGAHIGAAGMLGIDSMANHRVLFDFVEQRMDIRPATRSEVHRRPREVDADAIIVTGRRVGGRLILSNASIDGQRVDVVIDTGAQNSIGNRALTRMLQRQRAARLRLSDSSAQGANGGLLPVSLARIERIEIGGVTVQDMPIAFGESPAFAELNLSRRPALLLGMDALRLFDRVVVDFTNRRVLFDLPGGSSRLPGQRMAATDSLPGGG